MPSEILAMKDLNTTVDGIEKRFGVVAKRVDLCPSHGEFVAVCVKREDLEKWHGCPQCASELRSAKELDELEAERKKRAGARIERLLGRSAVPSRFASKTFADFVADTPKKERVLAACVDYAENFPGRLEDGGCLIMLGMPGTGKTHLAAAVAQYVIQAHGMPALYTTVNEMVRRFKDNFKTHEHTETAIINLYASPALLVIGEIGAGWGTSTQPLYLFEIFNARYQVKLPTVMCGNLTIEQVRSAVGDRVADRLNEGSPKRLVLNWESHRGK